MCSAYTGSFSASGLILKEGKSELDNDLFTSLFSSLKVINPSYISSVELILMNLAPLKGKVLERLCILVHFWILFGLFNNFLHIMTNLRVTNSPLFVWSLARGPSVRWATNRTKMVYD